MPASYPSAIKSFTSKTDAVDDVLAAHVNDLQNEVMAIETELGTLPKGSDADVKTRLARIDTRLTDLLAGWVDPGETWTYASSITFTVPGDQTGKYAAGVKIKLTQTTIKYFYIVSSSYGAPNTTVTVTGGSDYSLANAAITANYYSIVSRPQGFPDWFNWAPSFTGFSVNPTGYHRFRIDGKSVYFFIKHISGTSNATGFTITVPIATSAVGSQSIVCRVVDAGASQQTAALFDMGGLSATVNVYKTLDGQPFTNSGVKYISGCQGFYPFA